MTDIFDEVADKAIADHAAALGKVHLCRFVVGFDSDDEQVELYLNPPVRVLVEPMEPDNGILHDTRTHLDPYWDLEPVKPVDPRIAHLRSIYTYGPSYNLATGQLETERDMIWPERQ